jgi:hypothetical protein
MNQGNRRECAFNEFSHVRGWIPYALFDALGIQNYVSIDAISRDGQRLFISRGDCPFDCSDERRRHYELRLPK